MQDLSTKTVRAEDVKIYRTRTILADLSGTPFRGALLFSRKPLPVYASDGRHLGFAHVFRQDGKICADMQIDYACEERLLAETQAERRWAWMIGRFGFRGGYRQRVSDNGSAGIDLGTTDPYLAIDEIVISATQPADLAIGLFGVEVP